MNDPKIEKIKRLALIAMYADDELMNLFVLKGGNAIDIIYEVNGRTSMDLDFSMENKIEPTEYKKIEKKISDSLVKVFATEGLIVFDVKFAEVPKLSEDMADFWGGYQIEFKVIEKEKYESLVTNLDKMRVNAAVLGPNQQKKFQIDISKHEFCKTKQPKDVDGYTIYVYSPEMLIVEKIRAICQQMREYLKIVRKPSGSARARDFFDLYILFEYFKIDLKEPQTRELLKNVFEAKRVPLELVSRIGEYREFHRLDFESVRDTVEVSVKLKDYDFYFNYVVEKCKELETFWVKQPPSF